MPRVDSRDGEARKVLWYLWESGDQADLTLRTSEKDFRAHKCIITAATDFFDDYFKEGQTAVIQVEESAEIIDDLLRHVYRVQMNGTPWQAMDCDLAACQFALNLRAAGKKYLLGGLLPPTYKTVVSCMQNTVLPLKDTVQMACEISKDQEDGLLRVAVEKLRALMHVIREDQEAWAGLSAHPDLLQLAVRYETTYNEMWAKPTTYEHEVEHELYRMIGEYVSQQ